MTSTPVTSLSRRLRVLSLALAIGSLLTLPAEAATCPPVAGYTIVELVGLGGPVTQAVAIADDGGAAGWSLDASWTSQAVRWSPSGQPTALSTRTGAATGISDGGRPAGWQAGRRGAQATLWSPTQTLRPPRGAVGAQAADVNDNGLAVGWYGNSIGDTFAARWDGSRVTSLASGPAAPSISLAIAVNNDGTIVGRGDFGTAPFRRALQWVGNTMTVLPTLGGGSDSATGITGSGVVSGGALSPLDSKFHGVLWADGRVVDLGTYDSHPTSAWGVNDCGNAVGEAEVNPALDLTEAIVWPAGGKAVALEALLPPNHGWELHTARAINVSGQVVGYGFRSGMSGLRAFLMTPQP